MPEIQEKLREHQLIFPDNHNQKTDAGPAYLTVHSRELEKMFIKFNDSIQKLYADRELF